jgi:hypothetical protein
MEYKKSSLVDRLLFLLGIFTTVQNNFLKLDFPTFCRARLSEPRQRTRSSMAVREATCHAKGVKERPKLRMGHGDSAWRWPYK